MNTSSALSITQSTPSTRDLYRNRRHATHFHRRGNRPAIASSSSSSTPGTGDTNNNANTNTKNTQPPRRLSRILQNYQNLESQQAELEASKAARAAAPKGHNGRPLTPTAKYIAGSAVAMEKKSRYIGINPQTNLEEPNVGVHGHNRPHWWALRVNPGRGKQVADAIQRLLPFLPPLRTSSKSSAQGGEGVELEQERACECWIPLKVVPAWNPKTGKVGKKTMRYEEGEILFIKTVLDREFVQMLKGNINVLGWSDREVFEGNEYPRPATMAYIQEVKAWEKEGVDATEDDVRRQMGLAPAPAKKVAVKKDVAIEEVVTTENTSVDESEFFYEADFQQLQKVREEIKQRKERNKSKYNKKTDTTTRDRTRRGDEAQWGASSSSPQSASRRRRSDYDDGDLTAGGGIDADVDADSGWYSGPAKSERGGGDSGLTDSFEESEVYGDGWFSGRGSADDGEYFNFDPNGPNRGVANDGGTVVGADGGLLSDDDLELWIGDGTGVRGTGTGTGTNTGNTGSIGGGDAMFGAGDDELNAIWGEDPLSAQSRSQSRSQPSAGGGWGGRRERDDRREQTQPQRRNTNQRNMSTRSRGSGSYDEELDRVVTSWGGRDSGNGGGGGGTDDSLWWWDDVGTDTSADSSTPAAGSAVEGERGSSTFNEPSSTSAPSPTPPPPQNQKGVAKGSEIEVVSGRFQDFEGTVIESEGGVVKARLDVFGMPTVVEVGQDEVRAVNDDVDFD